MPAAHATREFLLGCFQAALAAVDARRSVRDALSSDRLDGDWHVVAIGKAAGAMTLGAAEHLGDHLATGLVVTKADHVPPGLAADPRLQVIASSHPLPDERSLAAGEAVARFVGDLPPHASLLFLVSGGASSLVERLAGDLSVEELRQVNAWALSSGWDIVRVNAVRRAVSTLKGGGLATLAGRRRCRALLISDVPGDDPAVIGSGLLHRASGAPQVLPTLPADIAALVARAVRQGSGRAAVPQVPYRIVASVRDACRAAAASARAAGFETRMSRTRFAGDAQRLGRRFARSVRAGAPRILHVWGGESTMILPRDPGYGGRNQHLALAAATVLAGAADAALLAAGTDGIDGVTRDAGALVDGGTLERGADAGLDASQCLARADSGRFLEASGDLLHTGPTYTNVGDLVLGLRGSRSA